MGNLSDLTTFQSTLPTRGSDAQDGNENIKPMKFQSTLPTRGSDRPPKSRPCARCIFQSTLPTRGSDGRVLRRRRARGRHFNPRSPRGGATHKYNVAADSQAFQSTLPTRGSDCTHDVLPEAIEFFSIHAPHEGERLRPPLKVLSMALFNPRSPRGGATDRLLGAPVYMSFSIHAPHEGERPALGDISALDVYIFQSTLPTRGSDVPRLQ